MINVHLNFDLHETQQYHFQHARRSTAQSAHALLRCRRLLQRLGCLALRVYHPQPPPKKLKVYAVHRRTLGCYVYCTLLTYDGSHGSPIVYSLGLHMRQKPMIAIDGRRRDGGPVRRAFSTQSSVVRPIGLTTVHAGPYIDVDCYMCQSSVLIVTVSQNNLVFPSPQ